MSPASTASPRELGKETSRRTRMFREIINLAFDSFRSNKLRFAMTGLGMVVGTASLILVVTIGLTGKQYILNSIQNIGANLIWARYQGGGNMNQNTVSGDYLTIDDMTAVEQNIPGIKAASPTLKIHSQVLFPSGRQRETLILGVNPQYEDVRRLSVLSGRFFDTQDSQTRSKVAVITDKLAVAQFGGTEPAIGQEIKIAGMPFAVIGTFREGVETFGETEIADNTILTPYSVARYFTGTNAANEIFFSMADAGTVPDATTQIQAVIKSRHRPESQYTTGNLNQLLVVASQVANALTIVLSLISSVTLLVSGIGIMNIMLATVRSRIHEIGIRKALGASRRAIRLQFLTEAVFISAGGGVVGTVLGVAVPYSVRFFTDYRIPISGLSILISISVSCLVGIIFGTLPAAWAAKLDPVESLRHE